MNKWKMNRAGLLNFWYYDEEIFTFANGKMLLRGKNGSGKSVTMQSFLPVLLDGRTSPDRLDPFGSKARRMEDYLLGEKEIVDRDERTGYLFLEFKREHTEQYTTIGIGLQARRNKPMRFWGFVITDNRRIGVNLELYKLVKDGAEKEKIPLSRVELENLIAEGGHVVQSKSEYMRLVNKFLFGFETIEAYEDLIKLLIQLRSPKLSKDFKPTVIYEILESALPPLTDEDLRHLSDTIEQMDQTKQQIEQLDREAEAIKRLNQVYDKYNQFILVEQANEWMNSRVRLQKEQKALKQLTIEKETLDKEISQLVTEINELEINKHKNKNLEERLRSHKVWNLEKERSQVKEKLTDEKSSLDRRSEQLHDRRTKLLQLQVELQKLEQWITNRQVTMDDKLIDMMNDAAETSFTETHDMNKDDFIRHQQHSFDFTVWSNEVSNHLTRLETIETELNEFERLKEKYADKNKELAEEQKRLDQYTNQEREWVHLFEEDKEKKLNEIHTWLAALDWLPVEKEMMQHTARTLHQLYEPSNYEEVKEPFRKAMFQYESEQREILAELMFEKDQISKKIAEKQVELQVWKDKKDPEREIDPLTKESRRKLSEAGITSVPFYAAVEFQDHVDEHVRKRIEAALLDSGILDVLIINRQANIEYDRVFVPNPQMMTHTLADYLKPDLDDESNLSMSIVDDVLRSITIGEGSAASFHINEQGEYELSIIKGHALPIERVKFIGRTARKRYREEQIANIQNELSHLEQQKQHMLANIESTEANISRAKSEFDKFPNDEDLQVIFGQIKDVRYKISYLKTLIERLSSEVKEIYATYKETKRIIDEQTRSFNITVDLKSYREAILIVKRYVKDLSELEKEHIQYVNDLAQKEFLKERMNELEEETIEISGEINILQMTIARLESDLETIFEQIERQGLDDIRQQVATVQQALIEIAEALDRKKVSKTKKEAIREQRQHELVIKAQEIEFWVNLEQAWKESFEHEVHLGFVTLEYDKELEELAEHIVKQLSSHVKDTDRTKLTSQLTQEFYKQLTDLMEYRSNYLEKTIEIPAWMNETTDEGHLPFIEQWKQKAIRQLIELHYEGKQVSPYFLQREIEIDQARQESYLDAQDRALYEEILFNTVGQKLRARIRRAEHWIKDMKKLMETRDTSSGLSFSIRWKPRTADSEAEMDTVDLVHLLKQDAKLLKDEDRDKITLHFRTKIERAKEIIGDTNELQTLLQVLKEVLDYRKWFSFVLYFQREGERKRELTNYQFYKFSGGEKAMAMYIPLFTASYSRYLEADAEAPYIISLDEAFAGVDENNIREMFEIVEKLGFNYIMNSQFLWGDYDTVKQLAIYELIRPKNAGYVSVIRYLWDGNKRYVQPPVYSTSEEQHTTV